MAVHMKRLALDELEEEGDTDILLDHAVAAEVVHKHLHLEGEGRNVAGAVAATAAAADVVEIGADCCHKMKKYWA